jgi:DNA-binding IclR family transcriptional regulator
MAETEAAERDPVDRYTVPGLERGLRILSEFSRKEPVLTPPEIARRLGVPRSTVFRLLTTLESMGFVERTDDGRAYRLGLAVLRLGFEYLGTLGITELARPILERARDETGFAASLVVRDGRDIVYILRAAARSPFASSVSVGTRLPAHATVLGHVLLSDLSLSQVRALYPEGELERSSASTPRDADALFELAQQARQRGHVLSEGFFEAHISTVAAPVHGENGHVIAALGLTIPGGNIPEGKRAALVACVRGAATELSTLLNYRGEDDPDSGAAVDATVVRRLVVGARRR